jgi:hypothetical protein
MENLSQYALQDGTYKSPKNGKIYKSEKALRAHMSYAGHVTSTNFTKRLYEVECTHCNTMVLCNSIKKHEKSCYLNPTNLRLCEVCNSPIKDYKNSKGTCSHSCSNKFFKHLRNKPDNYTRYTTLCWQHHEKKCVVCDEDKIVAVHHYNENHNDNRIENLVPLCPTHHQYMHSRYKNEILPKVEEYIEKFKLGFA